MRFDIQLFNFSKLTGQARLIYFKVSKTQSLLFKYFLLQYFVVNLKISTKITCNRDENYFFV